MRTSSYTIYVDLPNASDEMLLVHGFSNACDKVSRRVATYLRSLEARRPPKPLYGVWTDEVAIEGEVETPPDDVIKVLRRRGYLTDMSVEQEETFFQKFATKIHDFNVNKPPNYIFMPTYDCNLRCSYCFQDHMRTDPRFHGLLKTMSDEMIDRIFLGIQEIESHHSSRSETNAPRRMGFFGGEPLLAANRSAVEHIIGSARKLGPTIFWAVSNGTELEAYEDLLSPTGISDIQITIDGPPSAHDKRRIHANGLGTFDKIAQNIKMALDRQVAISVRMNIDRTNIGQLPDLADHIHRLGWDQYPRFGCYAAPIRASNDNVDCSMTFDSWTLSQSLSQMQSQYPLLKMIQRPDDGLKGLAARIFASADEQAPRLRDSFCSAHTNMYIFDAFGDIYACWERTGDAAIRMGYVAESGQVHLNRSVFDLWRNRTVASNPVCSNCRYALHCGGGCAVLAYGQTGKFNMNFCDGFASRFRSSVAEAYVEHMSGAELVSVAGRVCDQ